MTGGRAYRSERFIRGQLVYTPDGDVLGKHLHVQRRAPSGFDWGPEADTARTDQLAIAPLADSATKNIALNYDKEFAQYLREELKGERERTTSQVKRNRDGSACSPSRRPCRIRRLSR